VSTFFFILLYFSDFSMVLNQFIGFTQGQELIHQSHPMDFVYFPHLKFQEWLAAYYLKNPSGSGLLYFWKLLYSSPHQLIIFIKRCYICIVLISIEYLHNKVKQLINGLKDKNAIINISLTNISVKLNKRQLDVFINLLNIGKDYYVFIYEILAGKSKKDKYICKQFIDEIFEDIWRRVTIYALKEN
ncbi:hypothetical protein RFI_00213, partial [Reticulomyxa filosa]